MTYLKELFKGSPFRRFCVSVGKMKSLRSYIGPLVPF